MIKHLCSDRKALFQDSNASVHTGVTDWFGHYQNTVNSMLWPPKAFDMNSSEHLLHIFELACSTSLSTAIIKTQNEMNISEEWRFPSRRVLEIYQHLSKDNLLDLSPLFVTRLLPCHYWCEQCNLHFQLMHAMTGA